MRAHFANEIVKLPDATEEIKMETSSFAIIDSKIEEDNLKKRIEEFKSDSNNMKVVCEFIDKILQQAEQEANRYNNIDPKQSDQITIDQDYQPKEKAANGANASKHGNGKVTNLARVFVTRMFDAIYNCANNAVSTSIPRLKHGNLSNLRSTSVFQRDNTASDRKKDQEKDHHDGGKKYPLHEKTKNFLFKGTVNLMKSSN